MIRNSDTQIEVRTKQMDQNDLSATSSVAATGPFPELMTESELIRYLRIPDVSKSADFHNVIENLKRMHDLPRIHLCGKPLYPLKAIREWVDKNTTEGSR